MLKRFSNHDQWKWIPLLPLCIASVAVAQGNNPGDDAPDDEEIIELSPFQVDASGSDGYVITETLAGTRIKTDVRDLAASISTISEVFLEDTGSTGSEDLLVYTVGTEVGGLEGNFSGLGNNGDLEEELVAPQTNTRVRGLNAADNTRNYFRTDIPWDSYNTDAVTIQRGPNSILFGIAGPAGVINAATSTARLSGNEYEFENLIDKFGRLRNTLDLNQVILEDLLAVRFIGLDDSEKYRQKQAYKNTQRYYVAATARPYLLGEDSAPLNVNVSYEHGKIRSNAPRFTPPDDRISPWFDANKLNYLTVHPQAQWQYGQQIDRGTRLNADFPQNWEPWLGQQVPGLASANIVAIIDNTNGGEILDYRMLSAWAEGALAADGTVDDSIDAFVDMIRFGSVAGYNEYAQNQNAVTPGAFPGANSFWKNKVVTNTNIFDFYNNLIDGDNKREWTDFETYNFSISQTFWDNMVGVEYFYDFQELSRGGESFYSNTLSLDVNSHLFIGEPSDGSYVTSWDRTGLEPGEAPADLSATTGGTINPNVGRAFVSGDGGNANEMARDRENHRLTGFLVLDSAKFLDEDSWLSRIIGSHTFTGLFQSDKISTQNTNWRPFATDLDFAGTIGGDLSILGYNRRLPYAVYLSDDLRGMSPDNGSLGINPISFRFSPPSSVVAGYFDATWNAPDVDPGDPYIRPLDGQESTQSENPNNYVGWSTREFGVLSAENGDIDSLYYSGNKSVEEIDSTGIIWQGRMFDGLVIPTIGYREDEQTRVAQNAPVIDPRTQVVNPGFGLKSRPDNTITSKGETTTWGIVVRSPRFLNEMLPVIDDFTVFYNESENFSAEQRVGFNAKYLPNPAGESTDYGFTISAFDGKLSVKATWYETTQTDAQIPGSNILGANQWYLQQQIAWQVPHALKMEAYHRGEDIGNYEWYYNYAQPDDGYVYDPNQLPPEGFDHPSLALQRDIWPAVYATAAEMGQEWFDAWGYPIDVSKLQSPDWEVRKTAMTDPRYAPDTTVNPVAMQPSGGGTVSGLNPIGTYNQASEGFELEINYRPLPNLNIYVNAAYVDAYRGSVGTDFAEFLNMLHDNYAGPAGDIRQWWAGDRPAREYFDDFIWKPYLFHQESEGLQAPEVRPWRVNGVVSYSFLEGMFRGTRLGTGLRWEDDLVVGNELNDAQDNLDPNRPIKGGSEFNVDVWIGYSRELTDSITWDIQLNVKSLNQELGLVPVSVNPDGSYAAMRIREGRRWELRNSFRF